MMYWLYIAISIAGGVPGSWHHYPIDGWENEKGCQDVQKGLTAQFQMQYQEQPGQFWIFYCRAESKV